MTTRILHLQSNNMIIQWNSKIYDAVKKQVSGFFIYKTITNNNQYTK